MPHPKTLQSQRSSLMETWTSLFQYFCIRKYASWLLCKKKTAFPFKEEIIRNSCYSYSFGNEIDVNTPMNALNNIFSTNFDNLYIIYFCTVFPLHIEKILFHGNLYFIIPIFSALGKQVGFNYVGKYVVQQHIAKDNIQYFLN